MRSKYTQAQYIRPQLIHARYKLGYTQRELADMVGVNVKTYRLWENGGLTPNKENTEKLRILLCVRKPKVKELLALIQVY